MKTPRLPTAAALTWLFAGVALMALAHGRWAVPACAWLAPVFLVRFVRSSSTPWALGGFVIAHTVAWEIAYLDTVPLPAVARVTLFTGLSLTLGLVFLADRWASRRSSGVLATLILPTGWAAFEFLNGILSPSGTWGSIAYTFSEHLPLAQIVSVTGWTGLTFLVGWFAATVNRVWDVGVSALRGSAVFVGVLGGVLVLAGLRLAFSPPAAQTLRSAAIVAPGTFDTEFINELWRYTRGIEQPPEDDAIARARIAESLDEHFALVEREAQAGSELVVWAEANATLTAAEETAWLDRAQRIAQAESIYLGMGVTVFHPETRQRTENVLVLIGPDGEMKWRFRKATRVAGSENATGDGVLPRLDTEYGRFSAAICFDLDFPRLLRQAGRMDADLLIAPSNDWAEVRHIHLRMHILRAIEQGFTLFRPTKDGISAAADPYGRVLARLDTEVSPNKVMRVNLPLDGVRTLYSRVGDTFSWLCVTAFVGLLVLIARRPPIS